MKTHVKTPVSFLEFVRILDLNKMHTDICAIVNASSLDCHLHPLQAANCCGKSHLGIDEEDLEVGAR